MMNNRVKNRIMVINRIKERMKMEQKIMNKIKKMMVMHLIKMVKGLHQMKKIMTEANLTINRTILLIKYLQRIL